MLELNKYIKIKDNYCIGYFGPHDDYSLQLVLLKDKIIQSYPGINLDISTKNGIENTIPLTKLKENKHNYAHIFEIKFDGKNHPVEDFLRQSYVKNLKINVEKKEKTKKCIILTQGIFPTVSMKSDVVTKIKKIVQSDGYEVFIDSNINDAGLVIGVENYELFKYASLGIETVLYPTGIGENLFKKMFPNCKIFKLVHDCQ